MRFREMNWPLMAAAMWLAVGGVAQAQDEEMGPAEGPDVAQEPGEEPAAEPASGEPTEAPPAEEAAPAWESEEPAADWGSEEPANAGKDVDGIRFRGGVAFTGGVELVPAADFTAFMAGVDGRLGVQINDMIGVYAAGHLSFGSGETGFGSGLTGTFGAFLMADVTFFDALFAGGGFGYTVFNNPSGPALALRVGGYPVKSAPTGQARRKGLMVSLETRIVFLGGPLDTGYMIMGAVGYEAF